MAIDSNENIYKNRTLQFYGAAYGNSNVSLTATINNNVVFSGEVPTINSPIPPPTNNSINSMDEVLLFSLPDSPLFPTNWEGSYPVSITVSGGYGVIFTEIYSNYMNIFTDIEQAVLANSSIEGTTLTIGNVVSGNVTIGRHLYGSDILEGTVITDGSDLLWTINNSQTLLDVNLTILDRTITRGTSSHFIKMINDNKHCYVVTDVMIDDVVQPLIPRFEHHGPLIVPDGSIFSYNLNLSKGSNI